VHTGRLAARLAKRFFKSNLLRHADLLGSEVAGDGCSAGSLSHEMRVLFALRHIHASDILRQPPKEQTLSCFVVGCRHITRDTFKCLINASTLSEARFAKA
jgi:hypothetical protein